MKLYKIPIVFFILSVVYIFFFEGMIDTMVVASGGRRAAIHEWIEKIIVITIVTITLFYQIKKQQKKLLLLLKKEHYLNNELSKNITALEKSYEERKQMSEVLNKINNLVFIFDKNRTITWANQAFLDFKGYRLEEIVGMTAIELLSGPKTDINKMILIYNGTLREENVCTETINYKKNKEPYWAQLNLSPIFDTNGNLEFYISVETIITDRKEREEKIDNQNKALRQIAWLNSHEIRRPLASILSLLQLMKNARNKEERKELIDLLELCSNELDEVLMNVAEKVNRAEMYSSDLHQRQLNKEE